MPNNPILNFSGTSASLTKIRTDAGYQITPNSITDIITLLEKSKMVRLRTFHLYLFIIINFSIIFTSYNVS